MLWYITLFCHPSSATQNWLTQRFCCTRERQLWEINVYKGSYLSESSMWLKKMCQITILIRTFEFPSHTHLFKFSAQHSDFSDLFEPFRNFLQKAAFRTYDHLLGHTFLLKCLTPCLILLLTTLMNEFKPLGPQDLNDLVDFRTRICMYLNKVSSRIFRQISI